MIVTNTNLGKEHLVETCSTSHLAQRTNFNTRCMHVNNEPGETFVLGHIEIGTSNDFADIAVMRATCPNFLAGDDPFVAIAFGFCAEVREVATSTWFTEQLSADDVAAIHLAHVQFASDI